MTDPKRWTEGPKPGESLEQRVLGAGLELSPPPGVEAAVWSRFAAEVGLDLASGAAAETAETAAEVSKAAEGGLSMVVSSTGLVTLVLKSLGVGALLGALGSAGVGLLEERSPSRVAEPRGHTPPRERTALADPAPDAALPTLASPPATSSPAPVSDGKTGARRFEPPSSNEAREPMPSAPSDVPTATFPERELEPRAGSSLPEPRENLLRAEALELARAENLLERGSAAEAEALLIASSRRFSGGALSHEREALMVEALQRLGRLELARERARVFVQRFPNSALAPKMRRLVGLR